MASRGLRAPLSPNEELTLRRVALGIVEGSELPQTALAHLRQLGLVDDDNRMTDDGRARYEALDRPHKASILSEQRLVTILTAMKNRNKS
jgi:hypothetical protein